MRNFKLEATSDTKEPFFSVEDMENFNFSKILGNASGATLQEFTNGVKDYRIWARRNIKQGQLVRNVMFQFSARVFRLRRELRDREELGRLVAEDMGSIVTGKQIGRAHV